MQAVQVRFPNVPVPCRARVSKLILHILTGLTVLITCIACYQDSGIAEPPSRVETSMISPVMSFNCYNGTPCAILEDGRLVMWGSNIFGTIGNGKIDHTDGNEKAKAEPPYCHTFEEKIVDAAALVSSYALTENGHVYTWGLNQAGECGFDTDEPILSPRKVEELTAIRQVSLSTQFILALDEDGDVYHCGLKVEQFSNINEYEYSHYGDPERNCKFIRLPLNFKCEKIASSACSYVFLTGAGEVYLQGTLIGGAFREMPDLSYQSPTKLAFPEKIVDIVALTSNIIAVSASGNVYIFGQPTTGLSDETTDRKLSEYLYQKDLQDVIAVDGKEYCAMALTAGGDGYIWGLDSFGVINEENAGSPLGQFDIIPQPVKLEHSNIEQFSVGTLNGTALTQDEALLIWGDNGIGQLDPIQDGKLVLQNQCQDKTVNLEEEL